jgi:hypothetical protein
LLVPCKEIAITLLIEVITLILCIYKHWRNLFQYYSSTLGESSYLWRRNSTKNSIMIFTWTTKMKRIFLYYRRIYFGVDIIYSITFIWTCKISVFWSLFINDFTLLSSKHSNNVILWGLIPPSFGTINNWRSWNHNFLK